MLTGLRPALSSAPLLPDRTEETSDVH
jgi:hypothetical protein